MENKIVLLTGAGGGIGKAFAQALAEAGATLVLADLEPNEAIERHLQAYPGHLFVPTDIRRLEETDRCVAEALTAFGRLDVLVNNAALFTGLKRQPLEELSTADWEEVLAVNVTGCFHSIRSVTPPMKEQRSGKIINIASNVVHKGLPMLLHYVASKGAVIAMTRAAARELGPHGITVNAIAPGYVWHEGTAANDHGRNEKVTALRSLPRTQTPQDLVGTLLYLASDASDFVTGQTLVVDGGEVFG